MEAEYEDSGLLSEDDDLEGAAPVYPAQPRQPASGRQLRFTARSTHAAGHGLPAAAPVAAARRKDIPDTNGAIRLEHVDPLWLQVSASERFLLLEDRETGDVLMPLIYMKPIFEANYSRKLSSLKNRLVEQPADSVLAQGSVGQLYWIWAFESPQNVKLLVRQQLGEQNVSHGHLRLILLPIVYNAMAQKPEMRTLPLFSALHRAIKLSSYFPLLKFTEEPVQSKVQTRGNRMASSAAERELFRGPHDLQATAKKYMYSFREAEESDVSGKRSRGHQEDGITSNSSQVEASRREDLEAEVKELKRLHRVDMDGVYEEMAIMKNCIMQLYNVLLPGKLPKFLQQPAMQLQQAQQVEQTPPRRAAPVQHTAPVQGRQGMILRQSRRHQPLESRSAHGLADMAADELQGPAMHREPSAGSSMSDDVPPGSHHPVVQLAHHIKPEHLTSILQPQHIHPHSHTHPPPNNPAASFPFISHHDFSSGGNISPGPLSIHASPQSHTPAQVPLQGRSQRHQTSLHPYMQPRGGGPE